MLTSLRLKDWKSFGDGPAMPFGPLTLLVGPNGSGKSNVIDALRFLQGAALDLPLGEVLRGRYEGQREVWPGIRGHVAEAARAGTTDFEIETGWDVSFEPNGLAVRVHVEHDATLRGERLGPANDEYWYKTHKPPFSPRTPGDGFPIQVRGATDPSMFSTGRVVLGQILGAAGVGPEVTLRARDVQRALREIIFLDVQPGRMRDYRPEGAAQLGVNAENISPILFRLAQQHPDELQSIVDWLSELCAPDVDEIEFDQTRLGEVMMFLVERGGAKVSARSVSDGTLRFLGMVVALLTVPEGSVIVVEEPDVGLHPSRIHLLASLLEDTVKRRALQVVATTHSPTLLAHLSVSALSDVIAFGRDSKDGATIGRRIGDLPHFETLKTSSEMEHLVSTGWLERAL